MESCSLSRAEHVSDKDPRRGDMTRFGEEDTPASSLPHKVSVSSLFCLIMIFGFRGLKPINNAYISTHILVQCNITVVKKPSTSPSSVVDAHFSAADSNIHHEVLGR
jgi:hypothetical protein